MAAAPELARSSLLGDLKPQPQLPQRPRFSLGGQVSVMASSSSNSNSDLALAAAAAATSADLVAPMTSSMIASSVVNRARSTSSIYNAVADEFGAVKSLVCTCPGKVPLYRFLPSLPSRLNDCNNNDLTFLSFKIPCLHAGSGRLIS